MEMPIYYMIYFKELIPCYLIKEGYIPCNDYRPNINDDYYGVYSRDSFCIAYPDNKVDVFTDKKIAIKVCRNRIETDFNIKLRYLINDRAFKLKHSEEVWEIDLVNQEKEDVYVVEW